MDFSNPSMEAWEETFTPLSLHRINNAFFRKMCLGEIILCPCYVCFKSWLALLSIDVGTRTPGPAFVRLSRGLVYPRASLVL